MIRSKWNRKNLNRLIGATWAHQCFAPLEVTVTGQDWVRLPSGLWPVTVTLDPYFLETAHVADERIPKEFVVWSKHL